ncbi:hypothetical protein, partial [Anabaena sp. UHCC 0451]|uniref:hypothetical protein n=1 Tax=Anabaena sp. UHCC 0451 TaxID=2055235 RepID=UPI002B20E8C1
GNVSGNVTGTIQGLADNATSAATDIIITSYPAGLNVNPAAPAPFSLFSYLAARGGTGPEENSFTVNNGVITNDRFSYRIGTPTNGTRYQVMLGGTGSRFNYINLDGLNTRLVWGPQGNLVVSYSSNAATPVPFDIPGGATIPTVGSLFALGLMRQAKKRLAVKKLVVNPVETAV